MKFTYRAFLRIGIIFFLILGIGHLFGEMQMSKDGSIEAHLNKYDFRLLGSAYSLYQFHLGYSIMMGLLIIFIGLLLLTIKEPGKHTLLLLALGSIIICGLIWYFFAIPGQIFSTISAIFFTLAYWKYLQEHKGFDKPIK